MHCADRAARVGLLGPPRQWRQDDREVRNEGVPLSRISLCSGRFGTVRPGDDARPRGVGQCAFADPISAIAVATIIAVNGAGLFRENLSYLLGRSPGDDYLAKARDAARSVEGVLGLHNLKAQLVGPESSQVDLHIKVAADTSLQEANRIAHAVADRIQELTPNDDYVSVHVDPAGVRTA